ncbi:NAD(P)-binding protein [Calocera cornea HHB12733]|uniref:NAD(P)-binding protein n=1 Tax=Calocera cornea HHB12733 TaxID=1353952 RepID=A0A165CX66_9BASI|nr:NAD(P)-binding protein [Calocera cornea HHB12733]
MPAMQAPAKVLITGANGFLALYIVKQRLEAGYFVRGTVRSPSKEEWVKNYFSTHLGKFEYVLVSDITEEGAFNEAITGLDAVVHTASPLPDDYIGNYNTIYAPAVKGAKSICASLQGSKTDTLRVNVCP